MSASLELLVRQPTGLLYRGAVRRVMAEDLDGWFGIRPGRADLVAALPAGFIAFEDGRGEAFVAHAGGLLDLRSDVCRVMVRDAVLDRDVDTLAALVEVRRKERARRSSEQRAVFDELAREALRRLAREARR